MGSVPIDTKSISLATEIQKLHKPLELVESKENGDIIQRQNIIERHMGTMALTRGKNGDLLREAGALTSLLSLLHLLICSRTEGVMNSSEMKLAICALGALRDLACGSNMNRLAIGNFVVGDSQLLIDEKDSSRICTGIDIVSYFIKKNHKKSWTAILHLSNTRDNDVGDCVSTREPTDRGKLELKMMTAAVGVVRNITHSTRSNCEALFSLGMTEVFIWRLRHGHDENELVENTTGETQNSRLPDSSKPWREASFRIASSLINMSEKCIEVSRVCSMDDELIYILLETWGGISIYGVETPKKSFPVLHLGLMAILKLRLDTSSKDENENTLETLIKKLLERESIRKKAAQAKELQRQTKKKT